MKRNRSTRLLLTFIFGVLFSLILTVGASAELVGESFAQYSNAKLVYVSNNGAGLKDGSSVANAYEGLHAAFEAESSNKIKTVFLIVDNLSVAGKLFSMPENAVITSAGGDLYIDFLIFPKDGSATITIENIDIYHTFRYSAVNGLDAYISASSNDFVMRNVTAIPYGVSDSGEVRTAPLLLRVCDDSDTYDNLTDDIKFELYTVTGVAVSASGYMGSSTNKGINYIFGGDSEIDFVSASGTGNNRNLGANAKTIKGDISVTVKDNAKIKSLSTGLHSIADGNVFFNIEGGTVETIAEGSSASGNVTGDCIINYTGGYIDVIRGALHVSGSVVLVKAADKVTAPFMVYGCDYYVDYSGNGIVAYSSTDSSNTYITLCSSMPTAVVNTKSYRLSAYPASDGMYRYACTIPLTIASTDIAFPEGENVYFKINEDDDEYYFISSGFTGESVELPSHTPKKIGSIFLGWIPIGSTSSVPVEDFGTYGSEPSQYYSLWERVSYTIKYDANGGSGTMSNSTHIYGTSKALTLNGFTRVGYDFLGWSKSNTATSATYTNGQSVLNLSATQGAIVNLYAVWKKKTYTVSYNANGGSGAPSSQTKYYGTNLMLSTTVPTRSGYTFAGWSKTSSGSALYQPGEVYAINGSVTLYAVWTPKTYTVSYNANGGTGAPASQTKRHGTNLTLSSAIPTREGYEFNGWAISSTGFTMYLAGGTYSSNSSVTLYAVWSEIEKYTVSYNANGGTGAPASHSQEIGKTTAVSSSVPTRKGYIFKGWSVVKDGAVRYNSGDTYSGNADITLYAVWEKMIDPNAPIITVEKVTTVAGATVTVEVEIANNPGIWGLNAVVAFDNTVLTLTDVMCGDIFEGAEFVESTIGNSTYVLSFECSDFNDTELNGVLATLEFTVSKDAETGVYPITVTYSEGDIINSDEEIVGFELANGEVEVIDVIYGDVNGDGDVNKLDSLRLKKHLAGLDVEINKAAADVNADGAVNKLDSLRLKKHLAGLDVVLGK